MEEPRMEPASMRQDIIETARLVFRRQGFDRTRLQDITDPLGLSEAAFSACFSSMDELLEAVWSE